MKTLSITALFATALVANTAHAQFGQGTGIRSGQTFGQKQYPTNDYSNIKRSYGTQSTGYPMATCPTTAYPKTGYPQSKYPKNIYPKVYSTKYSDTTDQTLSGGKPWGERPATQTTGGLPTVAQNTSVPQELQGIWFDISPDGNLWAYVIRANSYDMFEVDPRTNQQVVINGQPVQVDNGPLTFVNGVLHLSPGADVEEGPFNTQATPDGSQLLLISATGDAPRTLTRQRQI